MSKTFTYKPRRWVGVYGGVLFLIGIGRGRRRYPLPSYGIGMLEKMATTGDYDVYVMEASEHMGSFFNAKN